LHANQSLSSESSNEHFALVGNKHGKINLPKAAAAAATKKFSFYKIAGAAKLEKGMNFVSQRITVYLPNINVLLLFECVGCFFG